MDKMYFLSESTSDSIPEQLALIVSRLPNGANVEDLFLGLVFTLALETGFQVPENEDSVDWFLKQLSRKAFHRWVFAQQLNITIEFFQSQNNLIAIVTGLVETYSQSCCFEVAEFVPRPEEKCAALKFSNLRRLSMKLRSRLWLCRIEAMCDAPYPDKTAFENLPDLVLRKIASYLPQKEVKDCSAKK